MTDDKRKKILNRVAALIAKAESTTFSEERDALRAKADDLMLRYAIEEIELSQRQGRSLRSQVIRASVSVAGPNSPYRDQLADLMMFVSEHARCRAVFYGLRNTMDYPVDATVVGMEADVEYVGMLFTSLRLQMASELEPKYDPALSLEDNVYAMRNAGLKWERIEEQCGLEPWGPAQRAYERACAERGEEPRKRINPKTVKRNFAQGYAFKVGARLRELRQRQEEQHHTSTALVPVRNAVDEAFKEFFPKLGSAPRRNGRADSESFARGMKAGSRADLGQSKIRSPKEIDR